MLFRWLLAVCGAVVLGAGLLPAARPAAGQAPSRTDVFVAADPATGAASIYFLDALSGLSTVVNASNGEKFTLVGDYVIYQKRQSGAIMRAGLNGTLEPHPFVRRSVDTQSVQWVVSPDKQAIAWVTVSTAGESAAFAAWADGRDLRQLPIVSPGPSAALAPIALTNSMTRFIYDAAHPLPDETEAGASESPFAAYLRLAEYDFVAGRQRNLPNDPGCPCDAALDSAGRILARLEARGGKGPFALHLWDLPSGAETRIPAPELPYHAGGDLVLNTIGTYAAYTIAAGVGDEAAIRPAEYGLVLVNIVASEQYLVLPPGPTHYRPLAFIDRDRTLLLADAATGATYKFDLVERELLRVSDLLYLGSIGS